MTWRWPDSEPAPVSPAIYRFNPNTTLVAENREGVGWPGLFPQTPCKACGGEYFRWVGDWSLGFYCVTCHRHWWPE